MVDVGYFINGKHGVIRNVSLTANPYSDHRVFTSADCKEQYCMKVDDIEYIIPHEEECCKVVHDEVADKDASTITYADKFKEVFGFEPEKYNCMCEVINCDCRENCQGCVYENWDWDDPYVKVEVKDDKC